MKKIIYVTVILAAFVFNGCKDGLSPEIELSLTEKDIVTSYTNMSYRCNALYTYLRNGFWAVDGALMASASDEAEHTLQSSSVHMFNRGSWNALNNPDNVWSHYYQGIRDANVFLATAGKVQLDHYILDEAMYLMRLETVKRWNSEVRFLRAYFYFELVKRYGGVPLLKEPMGLEDNYQNMSRSPLRDCIDFIVDECDEIAYLLPASYSDDDLGRATRGAVLALKSRVLLYAASDLFNDTSWAGGYSHPELIFMDYDRDQLWEDAANAAAAVLNLPGSGYMLASNYETLFRSYSNAEIILARRNGSSNDFERDNFPVGSQGNGRTGPSGNLVDAFEMANGTPFDWNNPLHAANPYENRDPRLKFTVLTNGAVLQGRVVEIWEGGADGKGVKRASRTGYYLKKYVNPDVNLVEGRTTIHTWILIRYAEILLNYAEAMNEVYGPDGKGGYPLSAREAVNKVRDRVGVKMPAVVATTKEQMRERIRHERRVEFAMEEQRPWDLRRWLTAEEELGKPLMGVDIVKQGAEYVYTPIEVESRVFEPKMYLYPLPQKDLNISGGKLVQNPMW